MLDTFSSAGMLAMLWRLAGIGTGMFDTSKSTNDDDDDSVDASLLLKWFGTTALSVPLWILVERTCSAGPFHPDWMAHLCSRP